MYTKVVRGKVSQWLKPSLYKYIAIDIDKIGLLTMVKFRRCNFLYVFENIIKLGGERNLT